MVSGKAHSWTYAELHKQTGVSANKPRVVEERNFENDCAFYGTILDFCLCGSARDSYILGPCGHHHSVKQNAATHQTKGGRKGGLGLTPLELDILQKQEVCRRKCLLCQQTSLENMNMTSNCDVTNSADQIQMTTICHWMQPPMKIFCVRRCTKPLQSAVLSRASNMRGNYVLGKYSLICFSHHCFNKQLAL